MASTIVDHKAYFRQSSRTKFSISFRLLEWHQFWRMLILSSVMSEYIEAFDCDRREVHDLTFLKRVAEDWRELSAGLLPNFEAVQVEKDSEDMGPTK